VQGFKTALFIYKPKVLFPSENSADWISTAQDSYCTFETKENWKWLRTRLENVAVVHEISCVTTRFSGA